MWILRYIFGSDHTQLIVHGRKKGTHTQRILAILFHITVQCVFASDGATPPLCVCVFVCSHVPALC